MHMSTKMTLDIDFRVASFFIRSLVVLVSNKLDFRGTVHNECHYGHQVDDFLVLPEFLCYHTRLLNRFPQQAQIFFYFLWVSFEVAYYLL